MSSFSPLLGPVRIPASRRERTSVRARWWSADDGAATAEYAIVIMAGVSFAGVLVTILRSGQIQSVLTELVQRALTVQ
jgi:hypothetical protein